MEAGSPGDGLTSAASSADGVVREHAAGRSAGNVRAISGDDADGALHLGDPRQGLTRAAFRTVRGSVVRIGYSTSRDVNTAASAVGISGVSTGDMDAQMAAIASYVNSHGGVLGRRVQLVNYDVKTDQAASNSSATAQAACTAWTEDGHAFVVMDTIGLGVGSNNLRDCLAKHGTPLIAATGSGDRSTATFAHPYGPFSPDAMTVDRYVPALVRRLVANNFFTRWDTINGGPGQLPVRIGVTHFENSFGNRYAAVLRKALAGYGLTITDEVAYPEGTQNASSGASAAVLKFKSDGVTHIFNANIVFYHTANSQRYYPRYAVDDYIATPALLAQQPGIEKQLHGAMGAGYLPGTEVPSPPDASYKAAACKSIMRNAEQDYSNQTTLGVMLAECDDFFLLVDALNKSRELSAEGLLRGVEALGESYVPTITYRTHFGRRNHAGASGVRDFAYDDACGCFKFKNKHVHPA